MASFFNPTISRAEKIKLGVEILMLPVAAISLVWGVWTYFDTEKQKVAFEKSQKSNELIEDYFDDELTTSWNQIIAYFNFERATQMGDAIFESNVSGDLCPLHAAVQEFADSDRGEVIHKIDRFIRNVDACMKTQTCEPKVLCQTIERDVIAFADLLCTYFEDRNQYLNTEVDRHQFDILAACGEDNPREVTTCSAIRKKHGIAKFNYQRCRGVPTDTALTEFD